MPRNTLMDLTNLLFEEIERISDEDMTSDDLRSEVKRANAISSLGEQIIGAGNLMLRASKAKDEMINADAELPALLDG